MRGDDTNSSVGRLGDSAFDPLLIHHPWADIQLLVTVARLAEIPQLPEPWPPEE